MIINMSGVIQYTIRPYDTLWMLAQVFNTTVDSIMDLNPGVDPRNLQIGQVISIMPGYQYYPVQIGPPLGAARPSTPGAMVMPGMPENGRMPGNQGMPGNQRMPNNQQMPGNQVMPGNGARPVTPTSPMTPNQQMPGMPMTPGNAERPMTPGMPTIPGSNNQTNEMVSLDYVDLLKMIRTLWAENAIWTQQAMASTLNELPESELIVERLRENLEDFATIFGYIYNQEAEQTLRNLLTEYITIFMDYISAVMEGNDELASTAQQDLYSSGEEIVSFLVSLNPDWSESEWRAMMSDYIDLLGQYTQEMMNQDYGEAIDSFDEMLSQALDMADLMADGSYENINGR